MPMTNRTKKAALAALLLIIVAVAVYQIFLKPPMLMWDGSPGATHYEVQIDGTLLGTFTETRAPLPRGFVTRDHAVQVRACTGSSCSPWQKLTDR
jgi:hypothetical protein